MQIAILNFEIWDTTKTNKLTDVAFRIPVYSNAERIALRNEFVENFGSTGRSQLVSATTYLASDVLLWINNNCGFNYCKYPMLANLNDPHALSFYNGVTQYMPEITDQYQDLLLTLPITSTSAYYEFRKFCIKINETYFECTFQSSIKSPTTGHYGIDMNGPTIFSEYYSGWGGNDINSYYFNNYYYYLVIDDFDGTIYNDSLYRTNMSGYTIYTPVFGVGNSDFLAESKTSDFADPWFAAFINTKVPIFDITATDPYQIGGGVSVAGGGTGNFDGSSDAVDFPSLPTLDATSSGFVRLFRPSTTELNSLANYMWDTGFDLDQLKKLFADPMDAILGLSYIGVGAPAGASATVSIGNVSTGVSMTKLGSQYFSVDCGSLNVQEFWGAYLDYAPYTKIKIALPYIGIQDLSIDDCMGKSVHVMYYFDALSGSCTAFVKCGDSVLYTYVGQCAMSIPLSSLSYTNMIGSAITIVGGAASIAVSGGATAPFVVPAMAGTAMNALKPDVKHSGSLASTGGILGFKTPFLILERPRQCIPKNQNKYLGYPSFMTWTIGNLEGKGFVAFDDVKLQGNSHMTNGELSELEEMLKGGVYL